VSCPNLVATSVYDTKPVHFLLIMCEEIKWTKKTREVYCVDTGTLETMEFLQLNINDSYNHDMGSVDIADQLRNYYHYNHWMRKRKWWWAYFFWDLGVLQTNAYICYLRCNISWGRLPSQLISHYDFQKSIALAWIVPVTHWPEKYDLPNKRKRAWKKEINWAIIGEERKTSPVFVTTRCINSASHFLFDSTNPNTFHQKQQVLTHAALCIDGLQMSSIE
jgi:hypothetical protein